MQQKNHIGFLYIGRLVGEKGFDLVLDAIDFFCEQQNNTVQFFIFGEGEYKDELMNRMEKFPNHVHYFGRQPHEVIKKYLPSIDYMLMPSRFLETFGLSAVEALMRGKPVIGPKKGGLEQFIMDGCDAGSSAQTLIQTMQKNILLTEYDYKKLSEHAISIGQKYTAVKRMERFQSYTDGPKKILLVSDYTTNLGGIEAYLYEVQEILRQYGYTVEVFGRDVGKSFWGNMLRKLGLLATAFNIVSALRLKTTIKKMNPDIIWFHSVSRFLGRLPVYLTTQHRSTKRWMVHDLGYFHPFPKKVFSLSQLPDKFSLKNFLQVANTGNPIKLFFVVMKYLGLLLIRRSIKKTVTQIFVPSPFLTDIVQRSYHLSKHDISVMPHFVPPQEDVIVIGE